MLSDLTIIIEVLYIMSWAQYIVQAKCSSVVHNDGMQTIYKEFKNFQFSIALFFQ